MPAGRVWGSEGVGCHERSSPPCPAGRGRRTMNSTFVVASREIAEKRFVFPAAVAFALLAIIPPSTMHMRGSFGEALTVSSAILSTAFAFGLAMILGASIVGRELTENRLSFYFARPLPAAAIWFGKVAASTLLITLSFLIVFAPAFVA